MKTRSPVSPAAPGPAHAEARGFEPELFTVDQIVHFRSAEQRSSLPLVIAMTVACEYLRVGKPFELFDLDDECIVRYDGTAVQAREPLDSVLLTMTQTLARIVEKCVYEGLVFLAGERAAARAVLPGAAIEQARQAAAERTARPPAEQAPADTPEPQDALSALAPVEGLPYAGAHVVIERS